LQDAVTAGENNAYAVRKRLILLASFAGGPSYMTQNFMDAMAICNQISYLDFLSHSLAIQTGLKFKKLWRDNQANMKITDQILLLVFFTEG